MCGITAVNLAAFQREDDRETHSYQNEVYSFPPDPDFSQKQLDANTLETATPICSKIT